MTQKKSQELIEFSTPLPRFYTWNLKWNPTVRVLYVFSKCRWVTLNIFLKTPLLSVSLLHTVQQFSLVEDPWRFHVSETLSREERHSACHSNSLWPTVCSWHWLAMTEQPPQASVLSIIYYVSEFLMLGLSGVSWLGFLAIDCCQGTGNVPFLWRIF